SSATAVAGSTSELSLPTSSPATRTTTNCAASVAASSCSASLCGSVRRHDSKEIDAPVDLFYRGVVLYGKEYVMRVIRLLWDTVRLLWWCLVTVIVVYVVAVLVLMLLSPTAPELEALHHALYYDLWDADPEPPSTPQSSSTEWQGVDWDTVPTPGTPRGR